MRCFALLATLLASAAAAAAPADSPSGLTLADPYADPTPSPPPAAPAATAPTEATPTATPPAHAAPEAPAIPKVCEPLVKATRSPSPAVALPAKVSLASCLSTDALKNLKLVDAEESVRAVGAAVAPSLELLEGVIAAGDPAMKLVALHAKGELLASLVIRMEATVPAPSASATEDAYALHDLRVSLLQPLLDPWRTEARASFVEVDKLARSQPQLAKQNASVASAVSDSQKRISSIATR